MGVQSPLNPMLARISPRSLKARIALATLVIFFAGVWSLSAYVTRMLREDMERMLAAQQIATVSLVANQIDGELTNRLQALQAFAPVAAERLASGTSAVQSLLAQRQLLSTMFNGGVIVHDADARAIADFPSLPGRRGHDYGDLDVVATALNEGRPTIGRPALDKTQKSPLVNIGVPLRDGSGRIVGVLVGIINLGLPNFLDRLTAHRYGKTGYYLLEDPQTRMIITGTERRRVMQPLPPPGANALIDRHVQGFDDTGVTVNPVGVEVLATARRIPTANWFVVAALPTEEAFAPIRAMEWRMVAATLVLTVLAACLTWWSLRVQLAPLLAAARHLASMTRGEAQPQTLPVVRHDEVGALVGGFNNLLDQLAEREDALTASERRFRDLVNTTDGIVWEADASTFTFTFVSAKAERLLGFPIAEWQEPGFWVKHLHPDDAGWAPEFCAACTGRLEPHDFEYRFIAKDGRTVWLRDIVTVVAENGTPRWLRGLMVDVTARKATEAVQRASEARYRAVAESANDAIVTADRKGLITGWNRAATTMFGYSEDDAIGLPITQLMLPQHRSRHLAGFDGWMADGATSRRSGIVELEGVRRDGSVFPLELSLSSWETAEGRFITATVRDITERRAAEANLRIAATAFESLEAMMIADAKCIILKVNRAFTQITGYSEEEAVGRSTDLLRSGRQNAAFYRAMWTSLEREHFWQGEIWNQRKNGEIFPERLAITAVLDAAGKVTHYVAAFSDISQHKQAQDEIAHLAFTDPLTELPNRRLLLDRLKQALATASRHRRYGALLLIDLDNFKMLNDTAGHDKGDLLLRNVAQRLTRCVREGDTVARVGGDEFVLMLEGLGDSLDDAAAHAETVGEKVLTALNQPYLLAGYESRSTPSLGITLFGGGEDSVEELLKQADLAMYRAKGAGRNALRFFDPQMQAAVSARATLETDLRKAIQEGELTLYYQAQVNHEGRLTGAEALVRWRHPERGMISPVEFIPLAEDSGLILPLGHWVLRTACMQLVAWSQTSATEHLTLAVNVSPRQFHHRDFVGGVLAALRETGADPHRLKLELTESLLVEDIEDTIAKMELLKAEGVSFSLDDFGTGYSSLAYLKRLPLDQLKIDQSFVRDVLTDPNDAAIAKTVVALGQSLGLAVIAEGVETEAQRDFLATHGCLAYQGYYFSRPLPPEDFMALPIAKSGA